VSNKELVRIVESASLPTVLLHVPDAEILAVSAEAARLLGEPAKRLVGRNVEEFAADSPGVVLDLIASGRVTGFQSRRHLRRADGDVEPLQVWVRAPDTDAPVTAAVVVLWPSGEHAWSYLPGPSDHRSHIVVGTVDGELQIERISDDVTALGSQPLELVGRPFLRLFDISSAADVLLALAECAESRRGVGLGVTLRTRQDPPTADLMLSPLNPPPSFSFSLCVGGNDDGPRGLTPARMERMCTNLHGLSVAELLPRLGRPDLPGMHRLTTRELDIVARLLAGDRVPAIAKALYLSPGTVRNHLSNVFHKMGVTSQQELIELFRESA